LPDNADPGSAYAEGVEAAITNTNFFQASSTWFNRNHIDRHLELMATAAGEHSTQRADVVIIAAKGQRHMPVGRD
jgi:hypothetical protein